MMKKIFYKHYVFLGKINDLIKENLVKFNNINIIIDIDKKDKRGLENELSIIKFAKKNNIPFLFKNDFQKCIKFNAFGIFIEGNYKKITKPMLLKKNFHIIGGAHNQLEYAQKLRQKCHLLMLSPLFFNEKYSKNKILNISKFNQKALNWKIKLCALGGINSRTLKKIKLTKCLDIGFKKFIFDTQIKKPAYAFKHRQVY
jgi:thiamine-phosphate pyrophosphorylase